uniref:Uncharacterized protein n=1 Tax=Arundo donax TaxID=35708 RepID=A0A0A9D233_ARUDO
MSVSNALVGGQSMSNLFLSTRLNKIDFLLSWHLSSPDIALQRESWEQLVNKQPLLKMRLQNGRRNMSQLLCRLKLHWRD